MEGRGNDEDRRAGTWTWKRALAVVVLAALAGTGAAADSKPKARPKPKPEPLPTLNARVVAFAREQLGQSVGDGECSTLVVEAFRGAGARRFPWVATGDYVWGREVASFRQALPGDIIQFRDAVFEGRRPLSGGRWQTWHYEYPHHTAIVAEVRDGGNEIGLIHQNVISDRSRPNSQRLVQRGSIRPASLRPGGRLWIYRPVGLDESPEPAPSPQPGERPSAPRSKETSR